MGGRWGVGYVYICMCACTSPHSIISHPHIGQSEATSSSICALTFACPLVPSDRWLWYWTTRLSRCRLHMYTSWRRRRKCRQLTHDEAYHFSISMCVQYVVETCSHMVTMVAMVTTRDKVEKGMHDNQCLLTLSSNTSSYSGR